MAEFDVSEISAHDEVDEIKLALTKLSNEVEEMKALCISRHEQEMLNLSQNLSKIRTKKISLQNFDIAKIQAEKEGIKKSMTECDNRKEVFLSICLFVDEEIKRLESASVTSLTSEYIQLRLRYDRECQRFDKALPIYSERSNILKIIERYQTCILIGETGSGKSTQLVQYLYEDGYAENGLIACTQPRKLAASSLAQHVSSEVNESVGTTYGFMSVKSKVSKSTKVLFMTDHTLLNECIADRNLSRYSCLVIDEAHERSIHTDILIALIKRCLPNRQDLKVIITSATIDPRLFSTYFGGTSQCPVIEVSGRTYPVDVVWENSENGLIESRNYVAESVSKAYDIHVSKKNEEGDILVFLTNPAEIEKACKLAQDTIKTDCITLPLHGKLQPEEQQNVFKPTPGKRKVVFSTNVAETSVTIPGIKYVIDTGLAKEMSYDPKKNMNTLEIKPISKSSANQRKGRAGRTSYGECYRLFSESTYESMRDDSIPEILRITLAFAVIKLYEFGIEDVHSFEFVDAPDKKALSDAVDNLKFLGAIKDGKLTRLGKKMALLPLEPNLSKILFDAIENKVGAEGAAAVAISTLAGGVFFRPSKDELQSNSDHKRLPFCQESGDQMTNLCTYQQWLKQDKTDRSKWCAENYVNGKSMRMVEHMVDELFLILKRQCGINLPRSMPSLDQAFLVLPRLFFDSFLPNLCTQLGHNRIGYWCEKMPLEQLIVHYGSSLHYLSSNPMHVIFEKTQKTSQHFMLQVLPVKNEWIEDAVATGKLPCNPAETSMYKHYQISSHHFTNIGPTLMIRLRRKYVPDRRAVIQEFLSFDIKPLFEFPSGRERGDFAVYAQKCFLEDVTKSVKDYIQSEKEKLKSETFECGIVGTNDDVRLVLGDGGCIDKIVMPDEVHSVVVLNLSAQTKLRAIEELENIGECKITTNDYAGKVKLVAKYKKEEDFNTALNYQFKGFENKSVTIKIYQQFINKSKLSLTWTRRERQDFTFIQVCEEDYDAYISPRFGGSYFLQQSSTSIKFQHDKNKRSIKVMRIPPHVDLDEVKSQFLEYWPMLGHVKISFSYKKIVAETPEDLSRKRQDLSDIIAQYVPRNCFLLDFQKPKQTQTEYRATIYFDSPDECFIAQQNVKLNHPHYHADISLYFSIRYHSRLFEVVKDSLIENASIFNSKVITFDDKDRWGNVRVKVTAKNIDNYKNAKDMVKKLIEPTELKITETNLNKYTSTPGFCRVIKSLQNETGTVMKLLNFNMCHNMVEIYGSAGNKQLAKEKLKGHLAELFTGDVDFYSVDLKQFKPGVLKFLTLKYDAGLEKLVEVPNMRAININTRKHVLDLFCSQDAYLKFVAELKDYESSECSAPQVQPESHLTDGNECCVCSEAHDSNKTLYRLEICGHVYCRECIELQLTPGTITVPITCAAYECDEKFVWKDFQSLFKSEAVTLVRVKAAAVKAYISANPNTYHACSTPDCSMIYLVTEDGKRFTCSQCGAHICTKCHDNWHEGFETCNGYHYRDKTDDGIRQWLNAGGDRKKCPKCSVPIEKDGGCNHVACQCGAIICWNCLKYFETSYECYGHLRSEHGGYGGYL